MSWSRNLVVGLRRRTAAGPSLLRPAAPVPVLLEPLENRQLMSVVYLSSSQGKDTNNGHASSASVKSISKAAALTKAGDTLLLKAGDTFGSLGNWSKSGVTIGSYGTGAKPKVTTGTADGLALIKASNFTVRGISFVGTNKTSRNGIVATGLNNNITIDNCDVTGFRMNVTMQGYFGAINGVKILNSRLTYSNGGGMSSGLYADKVNNLTLVNSVFDHNGGASSMYNHGAYVVATCNNVVVNGCTFSYNAGTGLQARAGGVITNNTFRSNSVNLSVGIVNGAGVHKDGGVTVTITNNLFTGGGSNLNGYGIYAGNIKSGTISYNRFIDGPGKKYGYPISLNRGSAAGKQVGVQNLTISYNTGSNWGSSKINIDAAAGAKNVKIFSNNL